jgi:hypothetical protein
MGPDPALRGWCLSWSVRTPAPLVRGPEAGKKISVVLETKRSGTHVLRLIVGLALLGWPRVGEAQGTWSVVSLPQKPSEILWPTAMVVDAAGNLYVADSFMRKASTASACVGRASPPTPGPRPVSPRCVA